MCGLGVEEEAFLALQEDMLFDLADMLIDERAAIKALSQVSLRQFGSLSIFCPMCHLVSVRDFWFSS